MKTSNRVADVILYGGPASGKSSQAKLLVKKLKAAHMNMGGLLRAEARRKTPAALAIKKYMNAGKLVPERISSTLAREFVRRTPANKRIVFDGYPRRMLQVRVLEPAVRKAGRRTVLLFIDLPVTVAKARIMKRIKLEGRADDANPKVIAERILIFHKNSQALLKFYRGRHTLITINGNQTIPAVQRDIVKAVK